jgi:trehalose 6-phosphate phosphatase
MQTPPVPDPARTALFLDIDGTLTEHCPHPEGVVVAPGLADTLSDLSLRLDGAIAFVTGRNLAMVDRLFGALDVAAAGVYGLERRLAGGAAAEVDDLVGVDDVFEALAAEFEGFDGVYFERKGLVLAIHTRAAPHLLPEVTQACTAALALLPDGYRALTGHAGVELLPGGAVKEGAIAWFMERAPFRGRLPVFLGDDTADESGFRWVNRQGGVSVRVNPTGPTEAGHVLASVAEVHDWLGRLAEGGR